MHLFALMDVDERFERASRLHAVPLAFEIQRYGTSMDPVISETSSAPATTPMSRATLATELDKLADVMKVVIKQAPETLTARQLLLFLAVARKESMQHQATLTQIMSDHGGLKRSIERSKGMLLEPSKAYPKAAGWLMQEHDPKDRRIRHLRLTPRGADVLAQMLGS